MCAYKYIICFKTAFRKSFLILRGFTSHLVCFFGWQSYELSWNSSIAKCHLYDRKAFYKEGRHFQGFKSWSDWSWLISSYPLRLPWFSSSKNALSLALSSLALGSVIKCSSSFKKHLYFLPGKPFCLLTETLQKWQKPLSSGNKSLNLAAFKPLDCIKTHWVHQQILITPQDKAGFSNTQH